MSHHEQDSGVKKRDAKRSMGAWWIGIAALCALGAIAYFKNAAPNLSPRNFGVVEEGRVYRSAALTPAATRKVVEQNGIRTIVDLGGFDKDPVGERVAGRTAAALGVERHVYLLEGDGTGNPNAYVAALRVMTDPSKQPVLVHCSAGAQRTSGCVMLYRELAQGRGLEETYAEARGFKHDPADNPSLMPYLKRWHGKIAEAFRGNTWIEGHSAPEGPGSTGSPASPVGNARVEGTAGQPVAPHRGMRE